MSLPQKQHVYRHVVSADVVRPGNAYNVLSLVFLEDKVWIRNYLKGNINS